MSRGEGGCFKSVWALALLLFGALPVLAEDAKVDPAEDKPVGATEYVEVNLSELPTLNTISMKLPVPVLQTPANVGTVSDRLIREQDEDWLGGALRT